MDLDRNVSGHRIRVADRGVFRSGGHTHPVQLGESDHPDFELHGTSSRRSRLAHGFSVHEPGERSFVRSYRTRN